MIWLLFFITFTSVSQIIGTTYKLDSIEIAQYDFPEAKGYCDALEAASSIGNGWRLPTNAELFFLYQNKVAIGFNQYFYWSSETYAPCFVTIPDCGSVCRYSINMWNGQFVYDRHISLADNPQQVNIYVRLVRNR